MIWEYEMNAYGPKERMTFSIDVSVKDQLERTIPKSKRSRFVEAVIAKALNDAAALDALQAIREFKPYPLKGPGVVEALRQIRAERAEQLASRHSTAKK
jgi:predicted phosphatase